VPQGGKTETNVTPVDSRRAAPQVQGAPGTTVSVISKALKITGQLESTEDIQIDGQIEGDVRGMTVRVGSNAKVKGTVFGNDVELSGTVEGKIEAKNVVLTSTAHMSGDVVHQAITIQSGAFIDGHCRPDFGKTESGKVVPVPKAAGATRD
jgi:cytoskeletal protein CcmA (bactofilin family)